MRVVKKLLLVCAALSGLLSCVVQQESPDIPAGMVPVEFKIRLSELVSKSSLVADDGRIVDYNLFLYRNGKLEWHLFRGASDPLTVNLIESETYSVYCVANIGEMEDFPENESEVEGVRQCVGIISGAADEGVPMASLPEISFIAGEGADVTIPMHRLAARFSFSLDRSGLRYGQFETTSIRLKQAANTVSLFSAGSRVTSASMVSDGDYASSDDLRSVNEGGQMFLYMLENMQGTLLPENSDPWQKEYFNPQIDDKKALCTYLEVCGRYCDNGGGLETENTYRMYLGCDATTNFDVQRNSSYSLTLVLSDIGAYRESWKVDRDELRDVRSLRFEPGYVTVPSLSSASVSLAANPSGTDYILEWDRASWEAASLSNPSIDGNAVFFASDGEIQEDREVLLTARTFDGLKSAVCTLKVLAPDPLNLDVAWEDDAPCYVAQSGVIRCRDIPENAELSAVSSDVSVARVTGTGGAFKVDALKEGTASVMVTLKKGDRMVSQSLDIVVRPVYLQIAGRSYEAFADGGANARRYDVNDGSRWSIGYDLDRSAFDDGLYDELLAPYFKVTGENGGPADWFDIDENGLFVARWGGDVSNVSGRYSLTASPRSDIYSDGAHPAVTEIVVNLPFGGLNSLAFDGENNYYMPEPGEGCEISASSPNVSFALGSPSNLRICMTDREYRYGEGASFVACPYRFDAAECSFVLSPSYDAVRSAYPGGMSQFRGGSFRVYASVSNQISGESSFSLIGRATVHLGLAVRTRLERWMTDDECDDDGDFFLIPCLYWEKFETGMVSLYSSGSAGNDPFSLPQAMITGMQHELDLYGSDLSLTDYYPVPGRSYSPWQLHDKTLGTRSCFNFTLYSYYVLGYGENLFDSDVYQEMSSKSGSWTDAKCGWTLYDPFRRMAVPDGGSFDVDVRDGIQCYLRIHDCTSNVEETYFDQ